MTFCGLHHRQKSQAMAAFPLLARTIASILFILTVRLTMMYLVLQRRALTADRPILIQYQLMPLINSRLFFPLLMLESVALPAEGCMLSTAQGPITYRDPHGTISVMKNLPGKHLATSRNHSVLNLPI